MTHPAPTQQQLITVVFEASERATKSVAELVPDLDRERAVFALASTLFEEAWVSSR